MSGDAASRLDEAMNNRRLELDLSWEEVARSAEITAAHLLRIRKGEYVPRELTKVRLERVLRWRAGSFDAAQDGGEPIPLDGQGTARPQQNVTELEVPEADARAVISHWGELSPTTQRILRGVVIEAKIEIEERLAERRQSDNEATGNGT